MNEKCLKRAILTGKAVLQFPRKSIPLRRESLTFGLKPHLINTFLGKIMDKEKSLKHNTNVWMNNWGHGYFDINEEGNVQVKPERATRSGDLYKLVQSLVQRGIDPPILIRFDGIIRDRIKA